MVEEDEQEQEEEDNEGEGQQKQEKQFAEGLRLASKFIYIASAPVQHASIPFMLHIRLMAYICKGSCAGCQLCSEETHSCKHIHDTCIQAITNNAVAIRLP